MDSARFLKGLKKVSTYPSPLPRILLVIACSELHTVPGTRDKELNKRDKAPALRLCLPIKKVGQQVTRGGWSGVPQRRQCGARSLGKEWPQCNWEQEGGK